VNLWKLSLNSMFIDEDLENTTMDNENPDYALWVDEDYCSPALAMEGESVLNHTLTILQYCVLNQKKKDGIG
jgi:hypothetical protein